MPGVPVRTAATHLTLALGTMQADSDAAAAAALAKEAAALVKAAAAKEVTPSVEPLEAVVVETEGEDAAMVAADPHGTEPALSAKAKKKAMLVRSHSVQPFAQVIGFGVRVRVTVRWAGLQPVPTVSDAARVWHML